MASRGFADSTEQMRMILDDATILDDSQVVGARFTVSLTAPRTRREPDGFSALVSGFSDMHRGGVRSTEDDDQVNRTSGIVESRVCR